MKITKKYVYYGLAAVIPILWVLRMISSRIYLGSIRRFMPSLAQYIVFMGLGVLAILYVNAGKDRRKMMFSVLLYPLFGLAVEKAVYMAVNLLGFSNMAIVPNLIIANSIQIGSSFLITMLVFRFMIGFSFIRKFTAKRLLHIILGKGIVLAFLLCIIVLCIWGEWMEIIRFQSTFYGNSYGLFEAMTAPGTLLRTVREWYIPYAVRACALLFYLTLVDEAANI